MLRSLSFLFLCLLVTPVLADGWFSDPPHMVLQVKNCDVTELHGLLGTLDPDAEYAVSGQTIVVSGRPEALTQVRELFQELDKPLSRIIIDIYGFEMLEGDLQDYGFETLDSLVRGRALKQRDPVIYNPGSPFHYQQSAGQVRTLFKKSLETDLGSIAAFKIPDDVATEVFASNSGTLSVQAKLLPEMDMLTQVTLTTLSPLWETSVRLNDGEPLIICGNSKKIGILMRSHLIR